MKTPGGIGRKALDRRRLGIGIDVLFEVANGLRSVVFEDVEVGLLEVVDRILILVGHDDIDDDDLGAGFDGVAR